MVGFMGIWALINFAVIPSDNFLPNTLPSIGILLLAQLLFFFVPYNLIQRENGHLWAHAPRLIGIVSTLVLNAFYDGK